ncbi:MAG: hypothetical protein A2015_00795 [Spirochaetes bacterium GWF1_31_7]|nr:MAG: hypothetical protein A2Y30_12660 [Spirochaetes bacterium GWE1_32_154]OHD51660.1 MAG: hypothetical protein A2Y29_04460 [Spirochaetes bacterium GWE2_31_10]OHD51913.1 MAG: hypothetical protein A2015_00795 [Spirochaetes bacterium GWF1_31_7]OHD76755.1 MAG: hypothetical protein A2355_09340 [Spirochaetes bacterium RIFOXYB1_FULL_32_8]HBD93790.1 hypothetical protein [Spirochaetia bacterium]
MDGKKIAGLLVLLVIIGGGVFVKFKMDKDKNVSANTGALDVAYTSKPDDIKITGGSGYKLGTITLDGEIIPLIKIPLVTWGGYAGLFAANNGIKPNKESLFYKNGKFVVELVRDENSNNHLQNYVNGNYPLIWSTMDMMPLLYNSLKADKRLMPQVLGLFDWSFGGDGIVVRGNINTPKDLKGKRIVTSGNTPSNFFLLWLLAQSDIKPSEVIIQYVKDAVEAKVAFEKDKRIDACVSWSPFIYELTDSSSKSFVDGAKLLITSKDANQLIADCYLVRSDFVKEKPEIVEAFVKSMMEGADLLPKVKESVFAQMATLFELPGGANEASLMLGDVHIANFPENQMFFDLENSISAYKIFFLSQEYYKNLGSLGTDVDYDAEYIINKSFLTKFKEAGMFANQQNMIRNSFNKGGAFNIGDLESSRVVLADDLQINFESQKIEFDINSSKPEMKINRDLLTRVSEQMNVLGTTVVKLIGHLDTSKVEEFKAQGMQSFLEASALAKLNSKKRAEYVKKILIEAYGCDKDRIITEGKGWDMPVDPTDQTKNRRVEVKFFSLE